jgi:very-short-patch-repair endonuclease
MADTYHGKERIRGNAPSTMRVARKLRKEMTPAEQRLWHALRDRQFDGYKFRRQHPIGRFVLDFYCARCHLAIELDGAIHRQQMAYDRIREERLVAYGYRVLRFTNYEVLENLPMVLLQIKQVLLEGKLPRNW